MDMSMNTNVFSNCKYRDTNQELNGNKSVTNQEKIPVKNNGNLLDI
jgi:hypothetical protein